MLSIISPLEHTSASKQDLYVKGEGHSRNGVFFKIANKKGEVILM